MSSMLVKFEIHHCVHWYRMKSSMILIMMCSIVGIILCILIT